jgi:hypothetical protein
MGKSGAFTRLSSGTEPLLAHQQHEGGSLHDLLGERRLPIAAGAQIFGGKEHLRVGIPAPQHGL